MPTTYSYEPPTEGQRAAHAAGHLIDKSTFLGATFLGIRAGRNHYERNQDLGLSFYLGAVAARRWLVWLFYTILWVLAVSLFVLAQTVLHSKGFVNYSQDGTHTVSSAGDTVVASLLLLGGLITIGVTYCRNVDYSLFRRRFVYRVFRPAAWLLEWCPSFFLYLTPILAGFVL